MSFLRQLVDLTFTNRIVDCLLYGELMLVAARKKENKKIKNVLKL